MATTSEIIQWVTGFELGRKPGDDDIPSETDLAEWLTPDAALQAEAREAVAAMGLIGPTATGSVWSDTPFAHGAGSPTDDPNEAIREVPLESWRWQAMGDPEARKAAAVAELRESIGADIDFDAVLAILESNIAIVMRPRLVFAAGLGPDSRDADPVHGIAVWDLPKLHQRWMEVHETDPEARHPLAPLVAAWLETRPRAPARSTVTVTGGESVAMTRRLAVVSHVRMTRWAVEAVDTVAVDGGGPMVARLPDPAAVFDSRGERTERARQWTRYRPGEQGRLAFRGLAPLPVNIRLAALAGLDTVLAGDMLMLWTVADALDHPMGLDEQTGARLLARTRSGDFRRPQPSDLRRFWDATATLRGLMMVDPAGTGRWAEVAHVESFPCKDGVTIGPPSWRRFGKGEGRYILTAEGGRAGRHRIAVGKQGAAGRLITGIEYVLGSRYLGARGVAPDLRPARGKGGPGAVLTLPLPVVAALMGEDDPSENEAARKRLNRAIETARPQYESGPGRHDTAPAGDSVEIIGRIRGSRAHPAALQVRASARFVEAARRAQLAGGKGFETVTLADWLGLDLDAQ